MIRPRVVSEKSWGRLLDHLILKQNYRLFTISYLKLARYKEIFPGAPRIDAIDARKGLDLFILREHLPLVKNSLQAILPASEVNDKLKRLSRCRRCLFIEGWREKINAQRFTSGLS